MNIAIYDTEHFETTYTLTRIFDTGDIAITLFVTSDVALSLTTLLGTTHSPLNWVIFEKHNVSNTTKIYNQCTKRKIDLLLLNTVSHHHFFFGILCLLLKKTRTILTIHDANSSFNPLLSFNFRTFLRFAGKKMLANAVSGYATPLSSTKEYICKNFTVQKRTVIFPGSFFCEGLRAPRRYDGKIKIVIPGSIDSRRRDYTQLYKIATSLKGQKNEFEFILLGGTKNKEGKEIANECKRHESENVKIKTYEGEFVSQEEYDFDLSDSDFVYAPLVKLFHKESTIPEQYGLTKSSGCFFDAVRFGKPILVPEYIFVPEELRAQCIPYKSIQGLSEFLTQLNDKKREDYTNSAIQNSRCFTLTKVRKSIFSNL